LRLHKSIQRIEEKQFVIKFDATKLIEPEQNISFAFEKRLKGKPISFQVQVDYIFDSYTQNNYNSVNFKEKGIRIIPEIRYYTNPKRELVHHYFGFQVLNKYAEKNYDEWAEKQNSAGINYLELSPVKQTKYVIAPHFLIGWHFYLSQSQKLSFDAGYRSRMVTKSVNNNVNRSFLDIYDDKNQQTVSFASNFKLCYFFNKF
jgi:hypothetical protein